MTSEPAPTLVEKTCATCSLWGRNFYPEFSQPNFTCCADVVMDLPASFIPNRQTMRAEEGAECICWQPLPAPPQTVEEE